MYKRQVSIIGVLFSSVVAKIIDYRYNVKKYLYDKREIPYEQFISMVYAIMSDTKKPEEQRMTCLLYTSTVVTEYEPVKRRSDSYQSEAELEKEFIRLLCEQGYELSLIHIYYTNATETTGIGTTEVPGTVTGNVQEKENNNSGSVSNIFDWAKDAISGAKDSVANVVENVTISTKDLVQKVENSLNHFIEAVAVIDVYKRQMST